MTATPPALLDTDMLSEVMRARDPHVLDMAKRYLAEHGRFTFSTITRYETAVVHDFILITGNVGHSQRIAGLQILNWRSN